MLPNFRRLLFVAATCTLAAGLALPGGVSAQGATRVTYQHALAGTVQGPAAGLPAATQPQPDAATGTEPTPGAYTPATVPGAQTGPDALMQPLPAQVVLNQNYAFFRANPTPETFGPLLSAIEVYLCQPGVDKGHASAVVKGNQVLMDLGVRAFDSGNVKLYAFPKVPFCHTAIVFYQEIKSQVTMVGRRHNIKKVTHTAAWRHDRVRLPVGVTLKDARMTAAPEGPRLLVLVGDEESNLWLRAYDTSAGLHESQNFFASIPSFLTAGVSGKVTFRGSDLIFMVARTVRASASAGNGLLPESDSSTYRFLLRFMPTGYILDNHLPDEDRYLTAFQFLHAISQGHVDAAKYMLADEKLISIPKYVGLLGRPDPGPFKVVELASPSAGVSRFRVVTFQKSDLIFDVTRGKDRTDPARLRERNLVKAIFIAPQDPFLLEIARTLPSYERSLEPPAPPVKPGEQPAG